MTSAGKPRLVGKLINWNKTETTKIVIGSINHLVFNLFERLRPKAKIKIMATIKPSQMGQKSNKITTRNIKTPKSQRKTVKANLLFVSFGLSTLLAYKEKRKAITTVKTKAQKIPKVLKVPTKLKKLLLVKPTGKTDTPNI